MCSPLLKPPAPDAKGFPALLDRIFEGCARAYQRRLHKTLNFRALTVLILCGVLGLTALMFISTPKELAPEEDQGVIFALIKSPQYANLDYLEKATAQARKKRSWSATRATPRSSKKNAPILRSAFDRRARTCSTASPRPRMQQELANLAVEANAMTVGLHGQLEAKLAKIKLVPASGLVEQLRVIKDKQEIEEIEAGGPLRRKGPCHPAGDAAARADRERDRGRSRISIAAPGGRTGAASRRSSPWGPETLQHAQPTNQKIGDGDFVLVDWGATARRYKSDLTRVLVTGKISPKLERVYNVVLKAQLQAIAR